jgi:hypothetical protein
VFRERAVGEKEAGELFSEEGRFESDLYRALRKHRRFLFCCETDRDIAANEGWLFRFEARGVCRRVYCRDTREAIIEDASRRVLRLPCLSQEKENEVWLIAPGTAALFFFFHGKRGDAAYYTGEIINFVLGRVPGLSAGRNDFLLDGKKAGGVDVHVNGHHRTLSVTAGLSYDAGGLARYAGAFDFSGKGYDGFAGFKDCGFSEGGFSGLIRGLYRSVLCLP